MSASHGLSRLRSLGSRHSYFPNADDVISPSIKKHLKPVDNLSDSDTYTDSESDSGDALEDPQDLEHLRSNAYSYVPEEYRGSASSDDGGDSKDSMANARGAGLDVVPDDAQPVLKIESQPEDAAQTGNETVKVPALDLHGARGNGAKAATSSDPKTDTKSLSRVFQDLERNLSDVRMVYRASLCSSSLESSVRKQDFRLSRSNLSLDGAQKTQNPPPAKETDKKPDVAASSNKFNLGKWYQEMPAELKNIVEVESSRAAPEARAPRSGRHRYLEQINEPISKSPSASPLSRVSNASEAVSAYMEAIKRDYIQPMAGYIEPLKDTLKKELSQLMDTSDSEPEPTFRPANTNQYYMDTESSRRGKPAEAEPNADEQAGAPQNWQVFDIRDDMARLTHVASLDKVDPLYLSGADELDAGDVKVVRSIGDYNIDFLSELSQAQGKCKLLHRGAKELNAVKPWFTNPINEKVAIARRGGLTPTKTRTRCVLRDNVGYVITRERAGADGEARVRYTLANDAEPGAGDGAKHASFKDLARYGKKCQKYETRFDEGDANGFYDPIHHFEKHRDRINRAVMDSDWATFGRPLVRRPN